VVHVPDGFEKELISGQGLALNKLVDCSAGGFDHLNGDPLFSVLLVEQVISEHKVAVSQNLFESGIVVIPFALFTFD